MAGRKSIRTVVGAAALALVTSVVGASHAQAATVYWSGKDVINGTCKGWLNKRTSDGYVQAVGQSWGGACYVWLERKRTGQYGWTMVSNLTPISGTTATGFHWNGTDAASRVCVMVTYWDPTLNFTKCGAAAW